MIKAVIVEDEGVAARKLQKMLEQQSVQVTEHFKTNKAFDKYLNESIRPDLFFLDIHLSDGIVFDTLQKHDMTTPIIFTTAYDEFAIKAFKLNSIDYLLKPINKKELTNSIAQFQSIYMQDEANLDVALLTRILQSEKPGYRERIKIKIGDKLKTLRMDALQMIYSENKITFVLNNDGRSYPIDLSVDQISSELNPKLFRQVNRAQIIHIDSIKEIISFSNSRLKIILEANKHPEIIVSRERVKEFKDWLDQ